jgi:hypothetical protein
LYRGLLRNHLLPIFSKRPVGEMREAEIRRWYKERLTAGPMASRSFG